jgi:hypothetical protein
MSSIRLWVRISNCSRLFLSMCGERLTVNFSMRVGSGMGPRTCAPVRLAVSTISRGRLIEHAMIKGLEADTDILRFHVPTDAKEPKKSDRANHVIRAVRCLYYFVILTTTPEPTVRPPSRMAKRSFSSIAIGTISSTFISRCRQASPFPCLPASHHARHVRRAEVELRTVVREERRVTAALFLRQDVGLGLELRCAASPNPACTAPDRAHFLTLNAAQERNRRCRPPHPGRAACGTSRRR